MLPGEIHLDGSTFSNCVMRNASGTLYVVVKNNEVKVVRRDEIIDRDNEDVVRKSLSLPKQVNQN